ncbi:hypothetical protein FB451DRAFT_1408633 [Mycena latifolia]|nr:hypothetical protein FB451DRAFT_1408633 [Mycena latifolia]
MTETIRKEAIDVEGSTIIPSTLEPEKAIKFYLDSGDCLTVWFLNTLTGILTPTGSPLLAEITVTFYPIRNHQRPYLLDADLMDTLGITLAAHPSAPRLRWRLDFHGDEDDGAQHFATFAEAVRRGMPKMQAEGRLALEMYVNPDRYGDGPMYEI